MSKYDIRPQFKCQNRILNIKIRYSARFRMSKNEKPKAKNEKRITKSEKRITNNEKRKAKNEKQTNFTLLKSGLFTSNCGIFLPYRRHFSCYMLKLSLLENIRIRYSNMKSSLSGFTYILLTAFSNEKKNCKTLQQKIDAGSDMH